MTSHTYEFNRQDVFRLIGPSLLVALAFAVAMHLGKAFGLWPPPRPTLDVDRTLLVHQVEATRVSPDATVLLLGDSSCLMDVAADELSPQIGQRALNLGTLSYLDLRAYAKLLRDYVTHHSQPLRAVVLLMHPEALRRAGPEEYHVRLLDSLMHGTDFVPGTGFHPRLLHWLGLDLFRSRFLCRVLPTPLAGAYGRHYGFSTGLEKFLAQHRGSLVEPDRQPFRGNAEYRLAKTLEPGSRAFRQEVPPNVKLLVGITPVPSGFAGQDYPALRDEMLAQWSQWLQADALLSGLPATLPDEAFAKTTHLTETGARRYTELLAAELNRHLP